MTIAAGLILIGVALVVSLVLRLVLGSFGAIFNLVIWTIKWLAIGVIRLFGGIVWGIRRIVDRVRFGYW